MVSAAKYPIPREFDRGRNRVGAMSRSMVQPYESDRNRINAISRSMVEPFESDRNRINAASRSMVEPFESDRDREYEESRSIFELFESDMSNAETCSIVRKVTPDINISNAASCSVVKQFNPVISIENSERCSIVGQLEPDKNMIFTQDSRTKTNVIVARQSNFEMFESIARSLKLARVLSIDGGGIRGVGPAAWCSMLEHITGKSIADMFNLLAGTSTGGLIVSGLAMEDPVSSGSSLYSADDIVRLYSHKSHKIFTKRNFLRYLTLSKYKTRSAYAVYNELFGDTKLSQIRSDCDLFVPYYNLTNNRPGFFKSHKAKDPLFEINHDFYLRDVVASTTAAPTYFKDFKLYTAYNRDHINLFKNTYVSAIDGCVAVNDPTACAMTQAESIYPRSDAFLLVSMGTGHRVSEVKPRGLLSWARHISTILMSNSSDMSEHMFRKFGIYSTRAVFFARLQFDVSTSHSSMDNISPKNISYLEHQARTTIPVMSQIRKLGDVLRVTDKPKREDIFLDNHNAKSMFIKI